MSLQTDLAALPETHPEPAPAPAVPIALTRIWPPVVLLALFWATYVAWRTTEFGTSLGFLGFLIFLAVEAVTVLSFAVWWLAFSKVTWRERLLVLAAAVLAGVGTGLLSNKLLGPTLILPGLPLVLTVWALVFAVARRSPPLQRRIALMSALVLSWGVFLLLRGEGMGGDGQMALRWRWSPTPEEEYLAAAPATVGKSAAPARGEPELRLQTGDWAEFRGPRRENDVRDVRIATDWGANPPKMLWKRSIGPAWSSVIVVGDRLFTQEQMGEQEAVVCLDVMAEGKTLWTHQDTARHDEFQGGPGPRATPTFADGRIYTLGATGILNCLDARTGQRTWFRDIAADAPAQRPIWGFSSSPLVAGKRVLVFAGGDAEKTLLAYDRDSGAPAWSAPAGKLSYSSPQLASVGGETQVLFVSERGLSAFDPETGALLWLQPTPPGSPGVPRSTQPRMVGPSSILIDSGWDQGTALVDVEKVDGSWTPKVRWTSRQLRPSFNDFVVHGKFIFGFDSRILTCIELETGRQRWKEGRYGSGQVLLLGDQPLLMVVTDEGKIVLVAANPDEHQELGSIQAIDGKTWNNPVIAHGRLYVRNFKEIACYELKLDSAR